MDPKTLTDGTKVRSSSILDQACTAHLLKRAQGELSVQRHKPRHPIGPPRPLIKSDASSSRIDAWAKKNLLRPWQYINLKIPAYPSIFCEIVVNAKIGFRTVETFADVNLPEDLEEAFTSFSLRDPVEAEAFKESVVYLLGLCCLAENEESIQDFEEFFNVYVGVVVGKLSDEV